MALVPPSALWSQWVIGTMFTREMCLRAVTSISPPFCQTGGRPAGDEEFCWENGWVLRPLGGLRPGEGGPSQRLSRAAAGAGEGADGASVGACVLAEALTSLSCSMTGSQPKRQRAFVMHRSDVVHCHSNRSTNLAGRVLNIYNDWRLQNWSEYQVTLLAVTIADGHVVNRWYRGPKEAHSRHRLPRCLLW